MIHTFWVADTISAESHLDDNAIYINNSERACSFVVPSRLCVFFGSSTTALCITIQDGTKGLGLPIRFKRKATCGGEWLMAYACARHLVAFDCAQRVYDDEGIKRTFEERSNPSRLHL
jgi:hypothetical protein